MAPGFYLSLAPFQCPGKSRNEIFPIPDRGFLLNFSISIRIKLFIALLKNYFYFTKRHFALSIPVLTPMLLLSGAIYRYLKTRPLTHSLTKIQVMKKIQSILQDVNVQGNLVVGFIFTTIIVMSILTWSK
jgi:uncharacterized membrane protein